MKRVSFNVAKAIKEAGYPQEAKEDERSYSEYDSESKTFVQIPYAIEVWLWLWREKKIIADIGSNERGILASIWTSEMDKIWDNMSINYTDPEEAIIAAIEYLVENNLIK